MNTYCTIHRVWYGSDCPACDAEQWIDCTRVSIDGVVCAPGDALRRARRVAGLSQRDVVAESGVGRHAVSEWEYGRHVPRVDLWLRALSACGYRVKVERVKE